MEVEIREMVVSDWLSVRKLYQENIAMNQIVFEKRVPDFSKWDHLFYYKFRYVLTYNQQIVAWIGIGQIHSYTKQNGFGEVVLCADYERFDEHYSINLIQLVRHFIINAFTHGFHLLQIHLPIDHHLMISVLKECGFYEVGIRKNFAKDHDGVDFDVVLLELNKNVT